MRRSGVSDLNIEPRALRSGDTRRRSVPSVANSARVRASPSLSPLGRGGCRTNCCMPSEVSVDLLAHRPQLIEAVGQLRWREWGYGDPSPAAWIDITRREAGASDLPVTFVAVGVAGDALGAVALGQVDDELSAAERGARTPWVLGMVVRRDLRRRGIGRLLLRHVEVAAQRRGCRQLWVATGEEAIDFYRQCGWNPVERLRLTSTGIATTILRLSVLDAGRCAHWPSTG